MHRLATGRVPRLRRAEGGGWGVSEDVVLFEEVLGMTFEVSVNEDGDVVYALFPGWPQ